MGRRRKQVVLKPLKAVSYHKENHHICYSTAICKKYISPSELCEGCKHYKLKAVDVADNPIRNEIDWGF